MPLKDKIELPTAPPDPASRTSQSAQLEQGAGAISRASINLAPQLPCQEPRTPRSPIESPQQTLQSTNLQLSAENGLGLEFSDDEIVELQQQVDTYPLAAAFCIQAFQLLGCLGLFASIIGAFVGLGAALAFGWICGWFLWTLLWCLCGIWVGMPLAKVLKIETPWRIGVRCGYPLFGPVEIISLSRRARLILERPSENRSR
jgi:hypothetical protein